MKISSNATRDMRGGSASQKLPRQRREALGLNVKELPERISVSKVGFDAVDERRVVDVVVSCAAEGVGGHVVTPNVDIVRQMQDPTLREIADEASIVVADGQPIVLASHLQGTALPERVTGSSLVWSLSRAALEAGQRISIIGGLNDQVAQAAADQMVLAGPPGAALDLVSSYSPAFGFERSEDAMQELRLHLHRHDPHIVFVGLGFPKQDVLARSLREEFPRAWFIGCGAGVAMLAGEVSRAPHVLRRLGMEWLFRLALEPRRLFKRYVVEDVPFAVGLLFKAAFQRFFARTSAY